METFVDLIEKRTAQNGGKAIFQFLPKGTPDDAVPITYATLSQRAKAIAIYLTERNARGQRVVIPSHSSPDFLANFFGCMYAGAVAVPTVPGVSERGWERTVAAAADCEAAFVLTNNPLEGEQIGEAIAQAGDRQALEVVHTGELPAAVAGWKYPNIDGDSLVFLQYTSGSTTLPRGVRITHRNLMCNQAQIRAAMEHDEQSTFVSWLPPFHDMGLVGGLLQPLYLDSLGVFFPSGLFSRNPIVWLQAITKWRAHTSGAPNFAYQMCCDSVTEQQLAALDLSSWRVAFNGAEPISPATLRHFTERFACSGFRPEAFFPCYGMAETTLMVSGNGKSVGPIFHSVDKVALEANEIRHVEKDAIGATELVACGEMVPGETTLILQPGGNERCPEHTIGEICVHGDNVTEGYWRNVRSSSSVFVEVDGKKYLRTGDLGFVYQRQLFVTGRIKDLMIIRGRNLYPQDLEATVTATSEAFRSSGAIAFSLPSPQGEQVVVAVEVKRTAIKKLEPERLFKMVSSRLSSSHEVSLDTLVLVKPLSLPRTTSGKLQRNKCRQLFLENGLSVLHSLHRQQGSAEVEADDNSPLVNDLKRLLGDVLGIPATQVDSRLTLPEIGIDSLQMARLQQAIAKQFSIEISAEEVFGGMTLRDLGARVAERLAQGATLREIPRRLAGSEVSLLPQQTAVYVHSSLNPQSTAYHVPLEVRFEGALDPHGVERALQLLVGRHELLRSSVVMSAEGPVFRVGVDHRVEYHFVDLGATPADRQGEELANRCASESTRAFSLIDGPLARFSLFRLRDTAHVLFAVFHHVIADGWALRRVFFEDFIAAYQANFAASEVSDRSDRAHFGDYSAWMVQRREAPAQGNSRHYWISKLAKPLPWPAFPGENPLASGVAQTVHRRFEFGASEVEAISAAAKRLDTSLYVYLLTCFNVAYARLCRQSDVCVGTMLLSRSQAATSEIFGFLANPVVIRTDVSSATSFSELVARVQAELLAATKHGEVAFADIAAEAKLPRRKGASPLFRAFFLQQEAPPAVELPSVKAVGAVRLDLVETRFDLEIHFWRKGDAIVGDLLVQTSAIELDSANALFDDFRTIAVQATQRIEAPIVRLGGQNLTTISTEARIERAILTAADVHECAVVRRGKGELALYLAYVVVRSQRPSPELAYLMPSDVGIPRKQICLIPVRNLPRTAGGAIAFDQLLELEAFDDQWVKDVTKMTPGAKIALRWKISPQQFLPLSAPLWEETLPAPTPAQALPAVSDRSAYAHGGELIIPDTAPVTLVAALIEAGEKYPNRGIHFVKHDGSETILRFPELLERAQRTLGGLQAFGLRPGTNAILQLTDLCDHLVTFWACLLGGVRPVAIAVASDYSAGNSAVKKLHSTWEVLEHPPVIASRSIYDRVSSLATALNVEELRVISFEELGHAASPGQVHPCQPGDVAFFQLTSGSTGISKCIQETHSGVIAHIHSSAQFNGYNDADVSLNWLPFDHVVPILTWHLKNTYLGCKQIELPTSAVLAEPTRWLDAIEKYRVTHSWSPNFGFKLVVKSLHEAPTRRWDLASLKSLMNAGEQVTVPVVREFLEATARFGVRPTVMQPAFGMAEACTCMTYTNDFDLTKSVHTFRSGASGGRLEVAAPEETGTISFVDLGPPTPGVEIRITNTKNELVSEGVIGRFQIRGPVITPGYFNNDSANQEAFVGNGWFNSGDLGYILNGRLAITGREKEQIIMQGVNYYCYEIEDIVNQVPGVIPTFAAACAVDDADTGTESFAVFFCTEHESVEVQRQLSRDIRRTLVMKMGAAPKYVIAISRAQFPKTTSGKIQRTQLKKQLAAGHYDDWIRARSNEASDAPKPTVYKDIWIRSESAPIPQVPSALAPGILVIDGTSPKAALVEQETGRPVVVVHDGTAEYSATDSFSCVLDSGSGVSGLACELERLFGAERKWHVVLAPRSDDHSISVRERYSRCVSKTVAALQMWAKELGSPRQWISGVSVVTTAAYQPFERRASHFEFGAVTALLQSLSAEWGLECRHIDLCDPQRPWLEDVLRELDASNKEPVVTVRRGERWVRRLEPVLTSATIVSLLRKGVRCVVVGGFGGVGLELCRFLLQRWEAKLLVIGRRPLEQVKDRFDVLTKFGSVQYETADAEDSAALTAALDHAEAIWGAEVEVVVHLAGIMPLKQFKEMELSEFRSACALKVDVALAIADALNSRPRAAVVYFSSVNARFGGAFASAYSFANAFLHELARDQRSEGRRAHCIAWSRWDGLGISAGTELRDAAIRKGFLSLDVNEALAAFADAVSVDNPSLIIGLDPNRPPVSGYILGPTAALIEATYANDVGGARPSLVDRCGASVSLQTVEVPTSQPTQAISESAAKSHDETTDIQEQLASIWQKYLKTTVIGPNQNFFDLGGGSVLLAQIQGAIAKDLYPAITLVDLFEYPTLDKLTHFIARRRNPTTEQQKDVRPSVGSRLESADIAIIGMACRYPGANSIEEFWKRLRLGEDCIATLPDSDLTEAGIPAELLANPQYVRRGGLLQDALGFDAGFFDYSRSEALMMDPQQRVLLMCAWEALEAAGYNPLGSSKKIGVFTGTGANTYLHHCVVSKDQLLPSLDAFRLMVANDKDFAATKISYKLGLTGPSINVQTACSTSLAAVHLACRSIQAGDCEMALAGAATIRYPHSAGYLFQKDMILSADGYCRPFDRSANGTVNSSGAGVILLKPLARALEDRDPIWAVIKGTALNNDGRDKVGYTAPGLNGQAEVVEQAIRASGVDRASISYIEAHGTGTSTGDPIELRALSKVFSSAQVASPIAIGSVKGNIGHTDTASGIAGLIKTACMLRYGELPPTAHFKESNLESGLDSRLFYINAATRTWARQQTSPRRAGISSFGIGGTNTHAILEEAPARAFNKSPNDSSPCVLTLSAKSQRALHELVRRFEIYLAQDGPPGNLDDICYTSNVGRAHWACRKAIPASSVDDLRAAIGKILTAGDSEGERNDAACASDPRLVFLFEDVEGVSQANFLYWMRVPAFRRIFVQCAESVSPWIGTNLVQYADDCSTNRSATNEWCDVGLEFAFRYSLAQVFTEWGIVSSETRCKGRGRIVCGAYRGSVPLSGAAGLYLRHVAERRGRSAFLPHQVAAMQGVEEMAAKLDHECTIGNGSSELLLLVGLESTTQYAGYISLESATADELSRTLARLYEAGVEVQWTKVHEGDNRQRLNLPTYPFQLRKFDIQTEARRKAHTFDVAQDAIALLQNLRSSGRLSINAQEAVTEILGALSQNDKAPVESSELRWEALRTLPDVVSADSSNYVVVTVGATAAPVLVEKLKSSHANVHWINVAALESHGHELVGLENWLGRITPFSQPARIVVNHESTKIHAVECGLAWAWNYLALLKTLIAKVQGRNVSISVTIGTDSGGGVLDSLPACALTGGTKAMLWEHPQFRSVIVEYQKSEADMSLVGRLVAAAAPGHYRIARGECLVPRVRHSPNQTHHDPQFSAEATYLITGGSGSLGRVLSEWLVERGARHLVLVGRKANDAANAKTVARLTETGAQCRILAVNLSNEAAVAKLFDALRSERNPLRGIFHLAGTLADEPLEQLSSDAVRQTLLNKALSAYYISKFSADLQLDHFVLFSSIVASFGSPSQASYAAANLFLEHLAETRRSSGQPGLAIGWGPWAGSAMMKHAKKVEALGLESFSPEDALACLGGVLAAPVSRLLVFRYQGTRLRSLIQRHEFLHTSLSELVKFEPVDAEPSETRHPSVAEMAALAPGKRRDLIQEVLRFEVAELLDAPLEDVEAQRGFSSLGLDSLMVVSLIDRLELIFNKRVSTTALFNYPNCRSLAGHIDQVIWPTVTESPGEIAPIKAPVLPSGQDLEALIEHEFKTNLNRS